MYTVSAINIYPVKSLGGYAECKAEVTESGLKFDRRWMLTDINNTGITQRDFPIMALFTARVVKEMLQVQYTPDPGSFMEVPVLPEQKVFKNVKVWEDHCKAQWVSSAADEWFSDILKAHCSLVYLPESTKRKVDSRYAFNNETTTFTDGYPFLMIGESTLMDLNNRLETPVKMDRFRANIIFTGGKPFEEDTFEHFKIGTVELFGVKRCGRCMVITIDQQAAKVGNEPLKTLSGYRKKNNKVYFGEYLLHKGTGTINIGDQITLVKNQKSTGGAIISR
jgi:uncharacterized protein YcbX